MNHVEPQSSRLTWSVVHWSNNWNTDNETVISLSKQNLRFLDVDRDDVEDVPFTPKDRASRL